MKYLLGLDIGTSATKTVLFDETMFKQALVKYEDLLNK